MLNKQELTTISAKVSGGGLSSQSASKEEGICFIPCTLTGNASSLPPLNEQQQLKLKQITLVSLALKVKVRTLEHVLKSSSRY